MLDKEALLRQLKIFSLSFIIQVLFGIVFVMFDDKILYNTDIVMLVGIGSLVLSSVSLAISIVLIWIISLYKKYKKHE
jgi:hypothetical protein